MKYNFTLLGALLFLTFTAANAKDKLTDDPKSTFTAKVNGKDFNASMRSCNIETSGVEFWGMSDEYFSIAFTLAGPAGEGVYEINKTSKNKASYGKVDSKFTVGANDVGKVTITKYDASKKLFSGTFEMKLTNAKTGEKVNITNGKFANMAFYDKPPKNSNEFEAKLNGEMWNMQGAVYAKNKDTAQLGVFDEKMFLMIGIPENITAGVYEISDKSAFKIDLVNSNLKDTFAIKTGRLIIVNNDTNAKIVRGRFRLEAIAPGGKGSVIFTDGAFSIFYKE